MRVGSLQIFRVVIGVLLTTVLVAAGPAEQAFAGDSPSPFYY